jgi:hypothetical protein
MIGDFAHRYFDQAPDIGDTHLTPGQLNESGAAGVRHS